MLILTIKTDQPEAELGLFENDHQLGVVKWPAHRELAESIHQQLVDLLSQAGKQLSQVGGIVCYQGPGSYTGLRIGLSVGNALSYSLKVPIVGDGGQSWIQTGQQRLESGENDTTALPHYGGEVHITPPKQ